MEERRWETNEQMTRFRKRKCHMRENRNALNPNGAGVGQKKPRNLLLRLNSQKANNVRKLIFKLCLPQVKSTFLGPNCTRVARCHFRPQKSLDFQGTSLPMALEMDFTASKSLRPAPYKQHVH